MRYFSIVAAIVITAVLGIGAEKAQAYFTTSQYAVALNEKTGLFLINFSFGHEDHDVYIPVLAIRGTEKAENALSYEILDDEDEIAKGTAAALVLSTFPLEAGMYKIPKGASGDFTLFALYTKDTNETDTAFSAQVTHLPFSFDKTQRLQLNPSELQYYVTPALQLT